MRTFSSRRCLLVASIASTRASTVNLSAVKTTTTNTTYAVALFQAMRRS